MPKRFHHALQFLLGLRSHQSTSMEIGHRLIQGFPPRNAAAVHQKQVAGDGEQPGLHSRQPYRLRRGPDPDKRLRGNVIRQSPIPRKVQYEAVNILCMRFVDCVKEGHGVGGDPQRLTNEDMRRLPESYKGIHQNVFTTRRPLVGSSEQCLRSLTSPQHSFWMRSRLS